AANRARRLTGADSRPARRLADWLEQVDAIWPAVRIEQLRADHDQANVGQPFRVEATIDLAGLRPADVRVDLILGSIGQSGQLTNSHQVPLRPRRTGARGPARFRSDSIELDSSGDYGLLVRVMPFHPDLLESQASSRALWGP